jgi:hypothetical protein
VLDIHNALSPLGDGHACLPAWGEQGRALEQSRIQDSGSGVCLSNDISRNIGPVMPGTVDYWGMNVMSGIDATITEIAGDRRK